MVRKLFILVAVMLSHGKAPLVASTFNTIDLAKSTIPAVVDVYAYRDEVFLPFDLGGMESMLFGSIRHGHSSGTGCIISADGIIVTCNHVIRKANRIQVGLNDGRKMQAEKIFADDAADVAFLRVQAQNLPFLQLADAKTQIELGEPVLVAGNAFGMGKSSIFSGIISFINRVVDKKVSLQSDVNIGVGNSGGPMVNAKGEMIAMAFAIPGQGGLSFFIPASLIGYFYNKEINKKPAPWWGVEVQVMTPEMLEGCGLQDKNIYGVIINEFEENSPAKDILKEGDVVTEINGQKLSSPEEFHFFEKISPLSEQVEISAWREQKLQKFKITPAEEPKRKTRKIESKVIGDVEFEEKMGRVIVRQSNSQIFQEDDIVLAINNTKIQKIDDIKKALKSVENGLSVILERGGARVSQVFSSGNPSKFF